MNSGIAHEGAGSVLADEPAPRLANASPDVSASSASLVDLAYQEFCHERERDQTLDPDAFCARFPRLKSSLRRLIQAHLFLEEEAELLSGELSSRGPQPGETFLGFRLARELGKGAFATVYQATEPMLGNRLVVVKVSMHGATEANILGRVGHPNIVPVHSVRVDNVTGLTAVCMPYLGSATLCQVLDQIAAGATLPNRARAILAAAQDASPDTPVKTPLPASILQNGRYIDGVCYIGAQLADALAFIHERGICHRDLKPSNVLMTPAGQPMLLDFNLSADAGKTAARQGGTLPYMPPEQLLAFDPQGDRDLSLLDPRSDIFSLGVILYELLTGTHPFGPLPLKMSCEELRRQLLERQREEPPPIRVMNPEVDKPLARLLRQCLAYNPNDRPSAAALATALRKGLSPLRRSRRWARRHPGTLFAAAVAAIGIAVAGFLFWSFRPPLHIRELHEGLAQQRQGQYSQAVAHFNKALETEPTGEAYFARGRAYQRLGESEKRYFSLAVADFQEADRLTPDARSKACLGYCLSRLDQTREAIYYYQLAVDSGLASAEVYGNLGFSYLKLHELDRSRENLERAIQLKPDFQAAHHNLARLFLMQAQESLPLKRGASSGKDEKAMRDHSQNLAKGIATINKALASGPRTAELSFDAATLCALAAAIDGRSLEPALQHLSDAVACGYDPKRFTTVAAFAPLRGQQRFKDICAMKPAASPSPRSVRVVDPISSP